MTDFFGDFFGIFFTGGLWRDLSGDIMGEEVGRFVARSLPLEKLRKVCFCSILAPAALLLRPRFLSFILRVDSSIKPKRKSSPGPYELGSFAMYCSCVGGII